MRRQHFWIAGIVAVTGLVLILLCGRVAGQMVMRRHEERYAANYDALTGLPNRRAIMAKLNQYFALAKQARQSVLIAFIDLDEFKTINDTYGHEVGDKFLVEGARRLSAGLEVGDMLGRWGGDEFIVIGLAPHSGPNAPDGAADAMRRRLVPLLIGPYTFPECSFDYRGASLGVVSADPSATSRQAALQKADQLMYADKQARRARQSSRHSLEFLEGQRGLQT